MKIVVQVKLMPEADQAPALSATLHAVNDAANWVSAVAFAHGVPREYELRKHTYAELTGPLHLPELRGRCPCRPECLPQHRRTRRGCVDCGA
ncbi:hypothetical protein CA984_10835 [Streptosporangium minutum]|uniref:Uncharacterized protein n=1 Tax=Streptosporangium minutum TaxID=569862 RepID=A0A243RR45_9ACTN|nr:hypothetical protein CA984_10835 [Streptosporangium minutum]